MKKQEFLKKLDRLASWWLDDERPQSVSKDLDIGISIECESNGNVSANFTLQPGKELELAAIIFNLTTGRLTTALIEEIGKQLGEETMNDVYNHMVNMAEEDGIFAEAEDELEAAFDELEDGPEDEPVIKPSEVFKEQ